MSILIFMPNWHVASELWAERMIKQLEPWVSVVVLENAEDSVWPNTSIPTYSLLPNRFIDKSLQRYLPKTRNDIFIIQRFKKIIKKHSIKKIIIHFLHVAVRFHKLIQQLEDTEIYIYCHGYDVTWNIRNYYIPHPLEHSILYLERIQSISQKVFFIANSECTKKRLIEQLIPENRIFVKYFGVPIKDKFPNRPTDTNVNILYLGRLVDCKGPDLTIKAFELACKNGLYGNLIIAGTGPLEITCELLRLRSEFKDRIQIIGAVNERQGIELRENADIFTAHNCKGPITNQEEAFGVSIIEAMGDGLPVVTGYNGGVVESILDNITGILVKPGDIENHAIALCYLANNPEIRINMGRNGWKRTMQMFSLDRDLKEMKKILDI